MLAYILKIFLIQLIGLTIYYAFLRNEKLLSYARTFIWAVIVFSFVVPFVQLPIFETTEVATQINNLPVFYQLDAITVSEAMPKEINWALWLGLTIGIISCIQLVRLYFSYKKITALKKTAELIDINIYASERIQLPFSFIRSIYVPSSFLDKKELPFVLAHEQAHIDKKHSWDKIVITLLARVFWFNPLFILFHKELELVHEYQVDETVIKKHSLEKYLESLLQSTIYLQSSPIVLTHSFFSSPIKNRIIMLHKKTGNTFFKRLASLALLLGVICSALYMQGRTVQKLPANIENQKIALQDTTIKENPNNGTFDMIVTNEDGTVSKYVMTGSEMAKVLTSRMGDSVLTYDDELEEMLLTVDGEDVQSQTSKKDTAFEANENGTYTMTYANNNGKEIKSVVTAKTMLAFLNRSAEPNSTWSLGKDNGLVLTTNIVEKSTKKPSNLNQQGDSNTMKIEPINDFGDGSFSIIDTRSGNVEIRNEQKAVKVKLSKEAQFPGGSDQLTQYLTSQIEYPQDAKDAGMEAKIYIEFKVNEDGSIGNLRTRATETTLKRDEEEEDKYAKKLLEKEAIRVIKSMPNWEPAFKENGEATSTKFVLPVVFQLPK